MELGARAPEIRAGTSGRPPHYAGDRVGSLRTPTPVRVSLIPTFTRAVRRCIVAGLLASAATAQSYCDCVEGLGPCGNDGGTALHGGCFNSTGKRAFMGPIGTMSVSIDDLIFVANQMPASTPVVLIMGPESLKAPFGDGLLCVGAGTMGYWRYTAKSTTAVGTATWGPQLCAWGKDNFPVEGWIHPGETWHFQAWFRDPDGPCGGGLNLTNGLTLTYVQ